MSRGKSYPERKKDNCFSFNRTKTLLPLGSRSNLVSVRVQEQGLHQTLIEVPSPYETELQREGFPLRPRNDAGKRWDGHEIITFDQEKFIFPGTSPPLLKSGFFYRLVRREKNREMPKSKATHRMDKPRCGLCGKTIKLIKTDCCGNWICNDEHKYVLFSYARNSCHRNHSRYTLCAYHLNEGHTGKWKDCEKCRNSFETEMYVWYGTNEYNFEKLPNPPAFEPAKCSKCGIVIKLGTDGFTQSGDEYWCEECSAKEMEKRFRRTTASRRRPKGRA